MHKLRRKQTPSPQSLVDAFTGVLIRFFGDRTDIFQSGLKRGYPCPAIKFSPVIEYELKIFSKIDITMTAINKNLWTRQKPKFVRSRPATENPTPGK